MLQGFEVERIVAMGGSQSAARLHSFLNGVAPHAPIFDAFVLTVHFGRGTPLNMRGAGPVSSILELNDPPYTFRAYHTQLRTDLGARIMVVNSETEARDYGSARQPDDDRFRLWEIAGVSHASGASDELERLFAATSAVPARPCPSPRRAAAERSRPGAGDARVLPSPPTMARRRDPTPVVAQDRGRRVRHHPPRRARDRVGGIRLPDVEVPLATLTAETGSKGSAVSVAPVTTSMRRRSASCTRRATTTSLATTLRSTPGFAAGFVLEPEAADLRRGPGTGATARLNRCRRSADGAHIATSRRPLRVHRRGYT